MILPPAIQKPLIDIIPLLTTAVIAPHGMTDLIHAETNDKVFPLFRINLLCVAGAMILHMANMDIMTNVAFMSSSAIASSSYVTELMIGKNIHECLDIKNKDIADHLKLPPVKLHCSMLAEDAIKKALEDYKSKQNKK